MHTNLSFHFRQTPQRARDVARAHVGLNGPHVHAEQSPRGLRSRSRSSSGDQRSGRQCKAKQRRVATKSVRARLHRKGCDGCPVFED